jgi:hypothetical protein
MLAHIHPFLLWFACKHRPDFKGSAYPGSESRTVPGPPRAQSPFARVGVTTLGATSHAPRQRELPPFHRSYELMRQTKTLPLTSVVPNTTGLCRLVPVPAGRWSFPTLSLQSVHRRLDPYPGMPLRCSCPFLPRELQPHPRCAQFGTSKYRRNATLTTSSISGRQSFRYVQAPMLASPPGCTHRVGHITYGQPGRLLHAMDWKLPSRTVVSLRDRIGQLSRRDFHPLDCSLVGRSPQRRRRRDIRCCSRQLVKCPGQP